ncbi:MAG: hypothetical protein V4568_05695 [Pseudomonadota bacterium]
MIKKIAASLIFTLNLGLAAEAGAVIINWDLTTASSAVSTGNASVNALTFNSGGHNLKVSAYCSGNSDGSGAFGAAHVQQYSGGLGIDSNGSAICSGDSASSSPEHAVDNHDKDNFLLFEFDSVMSAQAFQLGWLQTDSDVQVWYGPNSGAAGLNLSGACVSGCANTFSSLGFGTTQTFNDVAINTSKTLAPATGSRYVVMAGALGNNDDFFKVKNLSAKVPSPSSVALFAIGLLGLGLHQRRKQA